MIGYRQCSNQGRNYENLDLLPFRLLASFLDAAFSKSLMLRIFSSRSAVGIGIGAPPAIASVTVQRRDDSVPRFPQRGQVAYTDIASRYDSELDQRCFGGTASANAKSRRSYGFRRMSDRFGRFWEISTNRCCRKCQRIGNGEDFWWEEIVERKRIGMVVETVLSVPRLPRADSKRSRQRSNKSMTRFEFENWFLSVCDC